MDTAPKTQYKNKHKIEWVCGGGTCGGPILLLKLKTGPQCSRSASKDRTLFQKLSARLQRMNNNLKSGLFGTWPGGLREALAIICPPPACKGAGACQTKISVRA